jgi:hypothetical protein
MKALRSVLLAGCVGFAAVTVACPTMPAYAADGLPPEVKQQVDVAVGRWSVSGNVTQAGAAIADLCNQNPGVALDIVAYAGESAARSPLPERCLMSSSTCQELDQLLALLLERAMQLVGGRVVLAALPAVQPTAPAATPPVVTPPPAQTPLPPTTESGTVQGGDTVPPADEQAGGGNTGGGGGPVGGESGGVVPCQATGTCGGEPPPASYTSL